MLYLGQICKVINGDDTETPALFLGFKKLSEATKLATVVTVKDGALAERDVPLSEIGVIRVEDSTSPTGKSIYHGPFSTKVVNERIKLKIPEKAYDELMDADKLVNK